MKTLENPSPKDQRGVEPKTENQLNLEKYIKLQKGFKALEEHQLFDFIPAKRIELEYKILKAESELNQETKKMKINVENIRGGNRRTNKVRRLEDIEKPNPFSAIANYYKKFLGENEDSSTDIVIKSGIIPDTILEREDFKRFYEKAYSNNVDRIWNI